jgi:hypothetical protein
VVHDRTALVRAATPVLAGANRVACLDIGWVSAATDADVLDLAGLTDLEIATLPGGHTSKHVDVSMLTDRHVDKVLLWVDRPDVDPSRWQNLRYPRAVEARLAYDPLLERHFGNPVLLTLGVHGSYIVLSKNGGTTERRNDGTTE